MSPSIQRRRTTPRVALTVLTMIGAAALAGLLAAAPAQAAAVPAAATAGTATPASSKQVAAFDAHFTAAQLAQLRLLAAGHGAGQSASAGSIGLLAQAGFDRDHYWFKISTGEVLGVGVGVACRAAFPGVGWFVCPPISAAVQWAVGQWPGAGGFWAELYTDGRVRVGTW